MILRVAIIIDWTAKVASGASEGFLLSAATGQWLREISSRTLEIAYPTLWYKKYHCQRILLRTSVAPVIYSAYTN
jgi:hypothetical protein